MPKTENEKLRRAKKVAVGTSTASGLLGIGALGALGASRAPHLVNPALRTHKNVLRAQKIGQDATLPLSAASLGVGGVGSLNFAAVQNREANKIRTRKNVRKNMDISKRVPRALTTGAKSNFVRSGKITTGGPRTPKFQERVKSRRVVTRGVPLGGGQELGSATASRRVQTSPGNRWMTGRERVDSEVRMYSRTGDNYELTDAIASGSKNYGRRPTGLTYALAGTGTGAATGGGYVYNKKRVKKSMDTPMMDFGLSGVHQGRSVLLDEEVSKKDWKNISEHQRGARNARRTKRHGGTAAGWGGAAVIAGTGAAAARGHSAGAQAVRAAKLTRVAGRQFVGGVKIARGSGANPAVGRAQQNRALKNLKNWTVKENPYGTAVLGGAGLMGGGLATTGAGAAKERYHENAIARQRKARVRKAYKAYNPKVARGIEGGLGVVGTVAGLTLASKYNKQSKELKTLRAQQAKKPVRKAYKPYDPEARRNKRLDGYATGLATGGAGASGAAGVYGVQAVQAHRVARSAQNSAFKRTVEAANARPDISNAGDYRSAKSWIKGFNETQDNLKGQRQAAQAKAKEFRALRKVKGGRAAGLGAAGVGALVGSDQVRRYRNRGGRSYNTRNWD